VGKFFKIFSIIFFVSSTCIASNGFDALSYRPAADGSNFFSLWESDSLLARQNVFGITTGGAYKSFQFVDNNAAVRDIIHSYQMNHLYVSRGMITGWLSLGLDLPFGIMRVLRPESLNSSPTSEFAMGDPRIYVKMQFPDFFAHQAFSSGFLFYVDAPAGYSKFYAGTPGLVSAGAQLLLEVKPSRWFAVVFNFGPKFQKTYRLTNYAIGNQLTYGLGMFFGITKHWSVVTELNGKFKLAQPFTELTTQPAEGLLGARYSFGATGVELGGAMGMGIVTGVEAPELRALADLRVNF
jgi:hypothetical protein